MTKQYTFFIIFLILSTCISTYGDVYSIRKGDDLLIAVIGQPEYNQTAHVRDDGRISYFGGDLQVAGKTTEEVTELISNFLLEEELISKPIIMVSLISQENGVYVGGAVNTPGRYIISPESDIDINRAIALAGGITEKADTQKVHLIRYNFSRLQEVKSIQTQENSKVQDISKLVETYDLSTNLPMRDIRVNSNDLVYVTPLSVIDIQGEVKTSGKIFIHKKISIADALARVGGFTEEADRNSVVKVSKDGTLLELNVGEEFWKIAEKDTEDTYLSDGDVLFVPNAFKVEPIYVNGYVRTPGAHRVRGPMTIQKAIAIAGGFENEADRRKVHIHRTDGTTIVREIELGIDNLLIYPGDILEIDKKFEVNWGLISTISTTVIGVTYFIINIAQ